MREGLPEQSGAARALTWEKVFIGETAGAGLRLSWKARVKAQRKARAQVGMAKDYRGTAKGSELVNGSGAFPSPAGNSSPGWGLR